MAGRGSVFFIHVSTFKYKQELVYAIIVMQQRLSDGFGGFISDIALLIGCNGGEAAQLGVEVGGYHHRC